MSASEMSEFMHVESGRPRSRYSRNCSPTVIVLVVAGTLLVNYITIASALVVYNVRIVDAVKAMLEPAIKEDGQRDLPNLLAPANFTIADAPFVYNILPRLKSKNISESILSTMEKDMLLVAASRSMKETISQVYGTLMHAGAVGAYSKLYYTSDNVLTLYKGFQYDFAPSCSTIDFQGAYFTNDCRRCKCMGCECANACRPEFNFVANVEDWANRSMYIAIGLLRFLNANDARIVDMLSLPKATQTIYLLYCKNVNFNATIFV